MRVLVVSEGKHELGSDIDSSALVKIVRRLSQTEFDFVVESVLDHSKFRRHMPKGKSAQYEKKALGCVNYAIKNGFDALVFVVDQDGQKEREIGIENAQTHERFALPRAMGVAVQTFDAWMLADEVALAHVLECDVKQTKAPESLKKPKAKKACAAMLDASNCGLNQSELYFQIATAIDLDLLTERCPKGFAPFRTRVESLPIEP